MSGPVQQHLENAGDEEDKCEARSDGAKATQQRV
jgi:hypothetical protein